MTQAAITITVCTSCRPADTPREHAPGLAMLAAIASAAEGQPALAVRPTQCFSVCTKACTVSLSGDGRYTFLFGDLDPDRDAEAVVALAAACAISPHGFVPWKARPETLRKGIIARIPPPGWSPEDGSAPA